LPLLKSDPTYTGLLVDSSPANTQNSRQPIITVLGSGADVAQYANQPGFNVLTMPDNITDPAQKDAYNEYWLGAAYTRGDSIWLVTDPAAYSAQLKNQYQTDLGSAYFRVEIPMLQTLNNVNTIPAYVLPGGPPSIIPQNR
jgi:hypothetical protein